MDMDKHIEHGHAAWTGTCTMDIDMLHGHDMHYGHEHAPWTCTCRMDMDMYMQNSNGHVYAEQKLKCTVHAEYTRTLAWARTWTWT